MGKRFAAVLLALCLCTAAMPAALAAEPAPTLAYADLEKQVKEQNPSYLALEETIASIEALDYEKMSEDMRDALNGIASAQLQLTKLGAGDSYTHAVLGQSYDALRESFDDLKDGKLQEDNDGVIRQLRNAQNQMMMAAQTLYVALLDMRSSRADLQRQLDSMDRTVAEMELRHQRGQISDLQLAQAKNGRVQLKSGLDTLDWNIRTYTAQLQSLTGLDITGELTLTEVPEITEEQVKAMSYDKDLAAAREKSYTLYDAAETLKDAKDDYIEAGWKYAFNEARYEYISAQHTWQAAQHTYQSSQQSFELSFQTAYTAVADYRQILSASQTALALAKDTFASQELKYKQGNLSKNDYLDAQDELVKAETAVSAARHDLYSAYLTYQWAVEQGVLN